jgi:hypothetical protein
MKRLLILVFITAQLFIASYAQDKTLNDFELQIGERKTKHASIIPDSLTKEFFDNKAVGYKTSLKITNNPQINSILRRVVLLSVSRDVLGNYRRTIRRKGRIIGYKVGMVSHPNWYQSVLFDKKLYVIEGFNKLDGLSVFNELIKDLKVSVTDAGQAEQILEFYLRFYTIRFGDPQEIIISKVEDIPEKYRNEKVERVNEIRNKVHPLKITPAENVYHIDFFTWENFPRGEVNQWKVKVSKTGEIDLTVEELTVI